MPLHQTCNCNLSALSGLAGLGDDSTDNSSSFLSDLGDALVSVIPGFAKAGQQVLVNQNLPTTTLATSQGILKTSGATQITMPSSAPTVISSNTTAMLLLAGLGLVLVLVMSKGQS